MTKIEILIPVRNGFDQFRLLAQDLLDRRQTVLKDVSISLIDDQSTDLRVGELFLELLRNCSLPVRVFRNKTRLGFIGSVNKLIRFADSSADLLLLNSDTRFDFSTLVRMQRTLYRSKDIGSVTPLSDNHVVGIASRINKSGLIRWPFDHFEVNHALAKNRNRKLCFIPSGLGFCMLIRRSAWNSTGPLLTQLGLGYLDDVEWSLRAGLRGWSHVLATDCYVPHFGSASFGIERKLLIQKNFDIVQKKHKFLLDYLALQNDPNLLISRWKALMIISKHSTKWAKKFELEIRKPRTLATEFRFRLDGRRVWEQSFILRPDQVKALLDVAQATGLQIQPHTSKPENSMGNFPR